MGIEPTRARATIWCVNHFTTFAIILTRAVGIEPTLKVLETLVLPLNYARNYGRGGIRTPDRWLRRPLLYPAELPGHFQHKNYYI